MFFKIKNTFIFVLVTREELRDKMRVSGEMERLGNTPDWKKAFEMYKTSTVDYKVSVKCGSCFAKVKKWLKR